MAGKKQVDAQREELKQKFVDKLQLECSVSPDEASDLSGTFCNDGRKA